MKQNRFLLILVFLLATASLLAETRHHLVKPGDTLYSLAKRYEVTVEAIQAANPSVEGTNIKAGMTLVIPDKEAAVNENKEDKKNFFANLFKKKNKTNQAQAEETGNEVKPEPEEEKEQEEKADLPRRKMFGAPDNVVVILPFKLDSQTAADDRQQMRAVEFYEGFLLAVKEAEEAGQRILVQTYDLGTKTLSEILATKSLLDADMIIAPMELTEVRQIAEFGRQHNINVVSPFVFNQELSENNRNLIQLNTQKSLLYDNLTADIMQRFYGYDFVFLTDSIFVSKSDPYAAYLRNELRAHGKDFHNYTYTNPENLAKVDSILGIVDHNILYIPVTNTKEALQKMFPCLQCTTFDPELGALTKGQTAILGYPEWMLYTADFMDYYYDMNVYMFSKFYINPFDEEVRRVYSDFRYWYAKEPMPLTPRYALLGFDVGRYFLAAIRRHGFNFNENLVGFEKQTIQSAISFQNDRDGLINKGLYLVHFMPTTQIEKYEIK